MLSDILNKLAVFSQQKNRSVFWFVAACWLVLWGSCKLQESNHVRCIWLWSLVSFSHVWPCQFDTQAMKRSSLLAHSLYLAAVSHNYVRKYDCCVPSINKITMCYHETELGVSLINPPLSKYRGQTFFSILMSLTNWWLYIIKHFMSLFTQSWHLA